MAEKAKRLQVAKKVHIDSDGGEHRSAQAGQKSLEIRFLDSAGEVTNDVIAITRDALTDDMWSCAAWHGLAQKLGDTYADAKKKGLVPFDEASGMLEQIAAGNWVAESLSTGPRIGLLVEAVMAAKAAAGLEADEDAIKAKCADKEYAKRVKANDSVKAHYDRIVAERATARAKESAKSAKAASDDTATDLAEL